MTLDRDAALRPHNLEEYIGQAKLKDALSVMIFGARSRGEAMDHVLFSGPSGLGKTSISQVIASEMGAKLHTTVGPALQKKGDIAGILTSMKKGDCLLIDEIHAVPLSVQENLYSAMEDYRLDITAGSGQAARIISLPLPRFTIIGATTKPEKIGGPLRNRFGFEGVLQPYTTEELATIVKRNVLRLDVAMSDSAAFEIARRSRGVPRLANRYLRRMIDFAAVQGTEIDASVVEDGFACLGIDRNGLTEADRKIVRAVLLRFFGGPVGISTLAAALAMEEGAVADAETYLIQEGFIDRTPKGRVAGVRAGEYATQERDCQAA